MPTPRKRDKDKRRKRVPAELDGIVKVAPFDSFLWEDERLRTVFEHKGSIQRFGGRAEIIKNLALNLFYDIDRKVWKPLDAITIASVQNYYKFYAADPAPMGDTQWAEPRIDSLHRLLLSPEAGLAGLNDETVKGLLRSIGDAGASPANTPGFTVLDHLNDISVDAALISPATASLIDDNIKGMLRTLGDSGASPLNAAGHTILSKLNMIYANNVLPKNLLANSSFEWGSLNNWYTTGSGAATLETTDVFEGSFACKVAPNVSTFLTLWHEQLHQVRDFQRAFVEFVVKASGSLTSIKAGLRCYDSGLNSLGDKQYNWAPITYGSWTYVRLNTDLFPNTVYVRPYIEITRGVPAGDVIVDLCRLMELVPQGGTIEAWGGTPITGMDITQILAKTKEQSLIRNRSGALGATTEETILDVSGRHFTLETLTMGTNHNAVEIRISSYDNTGTLSTNPIRLPAKNGASLDNPSPIRIDDRKSDLFENLQYDAGNNYYVVGIKRKIEFAHGAKITVYNPDAASKNVAVETVGKHIYKTV